MGKYPFFYTTLLVAISLALTACERAESSAALPMGAGSAGGTSTGGTSPIGDMSVAGSSVTGNSCITIACPPQAMLWADLPATVGDPHAGEFQVCRNNECYQGIFAGTVSQYNTMNLVEPAASNGWLRVDLSFHSTATNNTAVLLMWACGSSSVVDFQNGDRYRIGLVGTATTVELPILDATVDYDVLDLGCAGSCLRSYTDQRSSGNFEPKLGTSCTSSSGLSGTIVESQSKCYVDDAFCELRSDGHYCTGEQPFVCPEGQVRTGWSSCGFPAGGGGQGGAS